MDEVREISSEELEKISGGFQTWEYGGVIRDPKQLKCPYCGKMMSRLDTQDLEEGMTYFFRCRDCGRTDDYNEFAAVEGQSTFSWSGGGML